MPNTLSKENELQRKAFELYYGLGDKRSLRAVAETVGRTERTVAGWSRAFNWVARVTQRNIENAQNSNEAKITAELTDVRTKYRMDDMVIFGSSKEELHKLKRELDEFMAVNLKQVLKHNWQVFPTKVRGVDFVGYRFFGEYTLLRKSTCKTFKRRMLSISSKRENNVSPTYSEWCSFNSYVGWLQHCDSFRLYQKYVEPNVEYMHNYYLKEVKGNAEICKRKNYSGERKAS